MTIDSAPRPAAAGVGLPTWWRRLLDLPLTVHAAGLAVALVLVVAVVGTHDVWNADEGAALAQVDLLADGQGWTADHPLPAVDPDGEFFPLDKAERGDDGG